MKPRRSTSEPVGDDARRTPRRTRPSPSAGGSPPPRRRRGSRRCRRLAEQEGAEHEDERTRRCAARRRGRPARSRRRSAGRTSPQRSARRSRARPAATASCPAGARHVVYFLPEAEAAEDVADALVLVVDVLARTASPGEVEVVPVVLLERLLPAPCSSRPSRPPRSARRAAPCVMPGAADDAAPVGELDVDALLLERGDVHARNALRPRRWRARASCRDLMCCANSP